MLERLTVRNFKSHKSTAIEFGALTLLTGVNSSGKSSLIQALLLLRQSFMKNRLPSGLDLSKPLIEIGKGQDVLHRMSESNVLAITVKCGKEFDFEYDVETALDKNFLPVKHQSENVKRENLENLSLFSKDFQYISSLRWGGRSHFDPYDYEVDELGQISSLLGQGECVAHFLYKYGGEQSHNYLVDVEGYKAAKTVELSGQVEAWMQRISSGITVEVKKGLTGGFDVSYGYAYDGIKPISDLRAENIGYGISHALPVVTALLASKPGALVILENPEAHLHPAGQAELAKLIARAAQNGVQVIVETHSDHIINGVLVAAKLFESENEEEHNCGVDKSKVRVYYIEKDPDDPTTSEVDEIKILEDGRVDHQPDGFFNQAEKDLCRLIRFGCDGDNVGDET